MQNYSFLAAQEVAKKFVVGWWSGVEHWNTWLLCLTPTLVALKKLYFQLLLKFEMKLYLKLEFNHFSGGSRVGGRIKQN